MSNILKFKKVSGIFIFILLSCFSFAEAGKVLDKVVAVVNSDVINQSELDKKISQMKRQLKSSHAAIPKAALLRKKSLDELIDNSLQLDLAKRIGLKIDDAEVNGIISSIAKSNNLTLAELKKMLPEKEGMTFNEFRDQIREQGLIKRVQQQFLGREITVTEKEIDRVVKNPPKIRNAASKYHVIDILFEEPKADSKIQMKDISKVAKKTAQKLKKRGSNIDNLVKNAEQDIKNIAKKAGQKEIQPPSVVKNDLGWRQITEFPDIFLKYVATMRAGQVVGPLEAPNGLHLLKLVDFRGSSQKITKDHATEIVFQDKLMKKLKPWLKEQREKAYIKINP